MPKVVQGIVLDHSRDADERATDQGDPTPRKRISRSLSAVVPTCQVRPSGQTRPDFGSSRRRRHRRHSDDNDADYRDNRNHVKSELQLRSWPTTDHRSNADAIAATITAPDPATIRWRQVRPKIAPTSPTAINPATNRPSAACLKTLEDGCRRLIPRCDRRVPASWQ